MIDILDAILAINPEAKCSVSDDDVDNIRWDSGQTPISKEDILAKQTELQTAYDAQAYARSRATEYPHIGDQLDSLFHAGVFPDDMTAILQAVKDKYPKE